MIYCVCMRTRLRQVCLCKSESNCTDSQWAYPIISSCRGHTTWFGCRLLLRSGQLEDCRQREEDTNRMKGTSKRECLNDEEHGHIYKTVVSPWQTKQRTSDFWFLNSIVKWCPVFAFKMFLLNEPLNVTEQHRSHPDAILIGFLWVWYGGLL